MITWFDALLVTLWAALTALGVRRGLSGLLWGVLGTGLCLVTNILTHNPWISFGVTAVAGLLVALLIQRAVTAPLETPLHLAAGALGGFVLGATLIGTLALSLPMDTRITPQGRVATYPSAKLPPALYDAVRNSALTAELNRVWNMNSPLRTLLIPDQSRPAGKK